ncbi:hypothetical protein PHMEG_0005596 [Phytophthora megakarya]|uniref:Reverse transcriptase n=1 Tax=Phytophthora megakarya TaxID=4795 RepID=A0A225WSX3_9STRA|nr:hypothetical protein PHMEG_0005596 [Phytophthora megakarya]
MGVCTIQERLGRLFSVYAIRTEAVERTKTGVTKDLTMPRLKFEADRESASNPDPVSELVNSPVGYICSNGEPDKSPLVPVFDRRSFSDDICFGSETFDGSLPTVGRLPQRFTECRISVSFTKRTFVQSRVDVLSHEVVPGRLSADAKKIKRVTEVSFQTSKKEMQLFLCALNYYSRFIKVFAALCQLKEEDFEPRSDRRSATTQFCAISIVETQIT